MKRFFLSFLTLSLLLPLLAGCGKYDYAAHISDERSDLFLAECDDFTVTVSCVSREYPYLCDGVAATRSDLVEATLAERSPSGAEYEIYFLEDVPRGGDMTFRSVTGDFYYSRSVETFPTGSISLKIVKNGAPTEIMATSVRTEKTLSCGEALSKAIEAEKPAVEKLMRGGKFCGEFHVRLLRRDKNYFYVGVISEQGDILSLLLDSETGKELAKRVTT